MQVVLNIYNTSIDLCVYSADEKEMDAVARDLEFSALASVDKYKRLNWEQSVHFEIAREDIIDFYKFLFDISLDYPVTIK